MDIDPTYPGTIIRVALAGESILNIFFFGLPYIFSPHSTLRRHFLPESTTNAGAWPSAEASSLMQWLGTPMLAITVVMLLAIPNKPGAIEARRIVYILLAVLEAMWIVLVLWQVWVAGEDGSGLRSSALMYYMAVPMTGWLLFRSWVLLMKPHWMGRYGAKVD